jgi:hypothetical protein
MVVWRRLIKYISVFKNYILKGIEAWCTSKNVIILKIFINVKIQKEFSGIKIRTQKLKQTTIRTLQVVQKLSEVVVDEDVGNNIQLL